MGRPTEAQTTSPPAGGPEPTAVAGRLPETEAVVGGVHLAGEQLGGGRRRLVSGEVEHLGEHVGGAGGRRVVVHGAAVLVAVEGREQPAVGSSPGGRVHEALLHPELVAAALLRHVLLLLLLLVFLAARARPVDEAIGGEAVDAAAALLVESLGVGHRISPGGRPDRRAAALRLAHLRGRRRLTRWRHYAHTGGATVTIVVGARKIPFFRVQPAGGI